MKGISNCREIPSRFASSGKIMKALLLTSFLCALSAIATASDFDMDECKSSMDRLRREARYANTVAESASQREIADIHSALDEVEQRLRRAKRDCGYASIAERSCQTMRQMALRQGIQYAADFCQKNMSSLGPAFCSQCLGR